MSTVAVQRCGTYDEEEVFRALKDGLSYLGGVGAFAEKTESVLLKLNLLRNAKPEKAVTTHPAVVSAFSRILFEEGYKHLAAGDSSGMGSASGTMKDMGLSETFRKYHIDMKDFREGVNVDHPDGRHAKSFVIAKDVLEADALISLCKMKTHALEYITGAVKNQYGCVCGLNKAKGHTVYPSQESFARMLIDLNTLLKPRLYIMDGITAMEGNGPASGDPVPMNLLMISDDPVAMDRIFCHLIDLPYEIVPTVTFGEMEGLGCASFDDITILLDGKEVSPEELYKELGNPDFKVERAAQKTKGFMGAVSKLHIFKRRPVVDEEKCTRCGVCTKVCPVPGKAISFANGRDLPPVYNKKCIKCFCCQEMCPSGAIGHR